MCSARKPWGHLEEVVLSFSAENEAQGHLEVVDRGWWCRRAKAQNCNVSRASCAGDEATCSQGGHLHRWLGGS